MNDLTIIGNGTTLRYPLDRFLWYVAPQLRTSEVELLAFMKQHGTVQYPKGVHLYFKKGEILKCGVAGHHSVMSDRAIFVHAPAYTISPFICAEIEKLMSEGLYG